MGCTTLAGVPSSSTDSVTGGSSWSGGRPGGNIGNSDGLPSLEEALKMPCPTGTAARCGWCSTGEDVEYVVRRADARPACPASFTSCSRRARDRFPSPPLPTLLFPPFPPRRWRLPPLQLPGRPLWGVGVGREAANEVVKCVEVSAPLVPPSYTH